MQRCISESTCCPDKAYHYTGRPDNCSLVLLGVVYLLRAEKLTGPGFSPLRIVHEPIISFSIGSQDFLPRERLQHHFEAKQKPSIVSIMRNLIVGNKSRAFYSAHFCFDPYWMDFKELRIKKINKSPHKKAILLSLIH